ncbi:unnamed protein product [Schistosoma margrebowiei]|uniref:Uncharacterized protein n=1 Tax=Schistosoma margrebowiei TaxID=48269 RepID=A0A183MKE5_9TREM|nr:unnamed protein product [Schistosoma margrebowiei]
MDWRMLIGGLCSIRSRRQKTPDPGFVILCTRYHGVPVIVSELGLPDEFDPVSPSFIVRDVTAELSGPRPT